MKIKIMNTLLVVVVASILAMTGCSSKVSEEGTEPDSSAEADEAAQSQAPGAENVIIKIVNPNDAELDLAAKNISRYARIKITYDGELPEYELKLGDSAVGFDILVQSDGELILKPSKPMHHLKEYTILDQPFRIGAPGDIDGDGKSDVVAGAPWHSEVSGKGAAFIFLGEEFPTHWYYAQWYDNERVVIIFHDDLADQFGSSLALGDLNGDGLADLAIGAKDEERGCVYLFMGSSEIKGTLKSVNDSASKICRANGDPSLLGASLAFGDVNADGFDDLLIGEPKADSKENVFTPARNESGVVHVVFGKKDGLATTINFTDQLSSSGVAVLYLENSWQHIGHSIAAGDMNGDGIDDVIVGAPHLDTAQNGKVFIVLGKEGFATMTLNGADKTLYDQNAALFGWSVSAMIGDEKDVALMTAKKKAYIAEYNASSTPTAFYTVVITADLIVAWLGEKIGIGQPISSYVYLANREGDVEQTPLAGDLEFGVSLSAAGDIDGDGNPDFVVGENQGPSLDTGVMHLYINGIDHAIDGKGHARLGSAVVGGVIR